MPFPLTLLVFLFLVALADAAPADVEWIPPGQYVEVAGREIGRAKTSIYLYMYLMALSPSQPGSSVHQLVDALAAAAARGVAVQVVLDQNVGWGEDGALTFPSPGGKNRTAATYLQAWGVRVFLDDAATVTHAKALVVDGTTVIVGSTNWSAAALERNVEATALIRSAVFARELLHSFASLALQALPPPAEGAVAIPWAFLSSRAWLGRMARERDEWGLDLYLHLTKVLGGVQATPQAVGYESLAAVLGLQGRPERTRRMEVRRVLYRLQRTYGLLTVVFRYGQDPVITLTATHDEGAVPVPAGYWDWGWDRRLTLAGKILYLLGLRYSAVSPMAPVWFWTTRELAATHGFSRGFAEDGLMDLRRHNLVEVKPAVAEPDRYHWRQANRYAPNELYDPTVLAQQFSALEARYGPAAVRPARAFAALVYEDSDVAAIERLIQLEGAFGSSVVRAAVRKVGTLRGTNPKKTMGYLIRTIEQMGRDTAQERANSRDR